MIGAHGVAFSYRGGFIKRRFLAIQVVFRCSVADSKRPLSLFIYKWTFFFPHFRCYGNFVEY